MNTNLIAVIDDDNVLRDTLASFLSRRGYEVVEAGDGATGIELIDQKKPDLILLDIIMPRVDGLAVVQHVLATNPKMLDRVIVMTNVSDLARMSEIVSLGVRSYFVKGDMDMERVVEIVGQKLKNSSS